MARPIKEGMDYFPHDTDAVNDEKIEALKSVYGNNGYAFYFILLERIYNSEDGRLDVSNKLKRMAIINKIGINENEFNAIMDDAFDVGLFDKQEYKENNVLTSNGIRKRFKEVEIRREKWRSKKVIQGEKGVDNSNITLQSKVKESKLNEIKGKETKTALESALDDFKDFRKKIKSPMTERAVELMVDKINKLATDDETKIEIINQSIVNGWKGIFPINNPKNGKTDQESSNTAPPSKYQQSNYKREDDTINVL